MPFPVRDINSPCPQGRFNLREFAFYAFSVVCKPSPARLRNRTLGPCVSELNGTGTKNTSSTRSRGSTLPTGSGRGQVGDFLLPPEPMKILKGEFATVPLKSTRGESPNVQTVYFRICGYANEDGICFPSIRELSDASGMSQETARKSIRRLIELGLVSKKTQIRENGSQTSNEYEVFTIRGEAFEQSPPLHDVDPPPRTNRGAPLHDVDPHNKTIKNQTI